MSALQMGTIAHVSNSSSRNVPTDAQKHLDVLFNAIGIETTPDAVAERRRQWECRKTARRCWKCDHAFADADIIWRGRIYVGRYSIVPLCLGCAPKRQYRSPAPCAHCGRSVANQYDGVFRRHRVCSDDCRAKRMIALQISKRNRERHLRSVTCTQCAKAFEPTRADSRYCSSRCRQQAYRLRKSVVR